MSLFSNTLQLVLERLDLSQIELSRRCGIRSNVVNRFVRGKQAIGRRTLETLIKQLPDQERAELVASWLRDSIPNSASGLVKITTPNGDPLGGAGPETMGELSGELDCAFRFLIDHAKRHTEIADLVINLARALQGEKIVSLVLALAAAV